ncbi:PucR family transcriptional regulator [Amycolatopsis australiensis]|uniref:Purine catabolism regulatory protein n=1 Tax=Amycolatopsis australiensis TaxID=546364 RepID=A0A1K1RN58_9PSEU|nr:PucR family transcriptional regulator [Amycolatopsis australiensis]SFW73127.1 purine catabolism regulatory protein [Amycolatopsis australiensis]
MPLTVQALLARTDLELRRLSGSPEALRRTVNWALISELPDPRPYLGGSELVLTTGSGLPAAADQYVACLVEAGAAALGFGLSAFYPEVPAALVAEAARADLPLLVVPASTGLGAVSRVVAECISDERQKELNSAVVVQRDLIRASLSRYAARAIVERLGKAMQGWALLLDRDGGVRAGPPAGRLHAPSLRIELPRLRSGSAASLSMTVAGESVVLLPLTVRERVQGFLAVGRSTPLNQAEQAVVTTAVSLLCAELRSARSVLDSERRNRLAVAKVAIEGNLALAASIGRVLGTDVPEGDLRVAILGVPAGHELELLEHAESDYGLRAVCALVAEWEPGRVVVLMPPAEGDTRTLEALLRRIPLARGAVSDPTPPGDLPDAWRQVRSVFSSASGAVGKLTHVTDVASAGLLRHLDNAEARGWAEALLAPLVENKSSKVDFLNTLRTFLANNGQADASASALGIHRHTLRYRMSKVAETLDRDLDDPMTRTELWIALQLVDRP